MSAELLELRNRLVARVSDKNQDALAFANQGRYGVANECDHYVMGLEYALSAIDCELAKAPDPTPLCEYCGRDPITGERH